jgi:hypothetical protein
VELLSIQQNVDLDQEVRDDVTSALDNSKIFTAKSLYRFITHRGVCIPASEDVWKSKLPLKIKVFMWQLQHNKLQVATSLKNRGCKGDIACCLCGEVESTNHVFFGCSISRFAWCCLRDAFSWAGCPSNWSDLMGDKVTKGMRLYNRLKIFVFAGIL